MDLTFEPRTDIDQFLAELALEHPEYFVDYSEILDNSNGGV